MKIHLYSSKKRVDPFIVDLILVYRDNNGAITQTKEPRSYLQSEHAFRCHHLFRKIVGTNNLKIEEVPIKDNIVDPLTLALSKKRQDSHAFGLKHKGY